MAIKYDVVAVTGKYTDANGNEKNRYVNMGRVITTKSGGFMLILDSIPVAWQGTAFLNDPKPRDGEAPRQAAQTRPAQQRPAQPAPAADDGFDDDLPPF